MSFGQVVKSYYAALIRNVRDYDETGKLPIFMIVQDQFYYENNYIRDHRKISFYDVTEEDPYKGGAIFTGMGIGEHYTGATWEDRGVDMSRISRGGRSDRPSLTRNTHFWANFCTKRRAIKSVPQPIAS